jgi:hypothetical protein
MRATRSVQFPQPICVNTHTHTQARLSMTTYPEDGLHLRQVRIRMFAREHLDDQTSARPNVRLSRVRSLLDDFGRHPENTACHRWSMDPNAGQEVYNSRQFERRKEEKNTNKRESAVLSSTFLEIPKSDILMPPLLSTDEQTASY